MKSLLVLLLSLSAYADENPKPVKTTEDWFCAHESGKSSDVNISVCGVASHHDEGKARELALDNAALQFKKLCNPSDTCRTRKVLEVAPGRTTCQREKTDQGTTEFKCYRLVTFELEGLSEKNGYEGSRKDASVQPEGKEVPKNTLIRKGMSSKDLIRAFGKPHSTFDGLDGSYSMWYYKGDLCDPNTLCFVTVKHNLVESFKDIKTEFVDLDLLAEGE